MASSAIGSAQANCHRPYQLSDRDCYFCLVVLRGLLAEISYAGTYQKVCIEKNMMCVVELVSRNFWGYHVAAARDQRKSGKCF